MGWGRGRGRRQVDLRKHVPHSARDGVALLCRHLLRNVPAGKKKHELMVAALRIACAACALAHACTRWQAALFIAALHVCGCGFGGNTLPGLGLRGQERT